MPRSSLLADCTRASMALGCALALGTMGFSQSSGPTLESTRQKLAALRTCLGQEPSAIQDLTRGLLAGWGDWKNAAPANTGPPSPPPTEYLDSLDRDMAACALAGQIRDDAQRQVILQAVARDIAIKAEDCRRFGMGRNVAVRVTTVRTISLRGPSAENGWEVFYKWNCSSGFQPQEMRIPQLSSPALVQLPPGNYTIRAQKALSKTQTLKTEPADITVGLQPTVDVELPIE